MKKLGKTGGRDFKPGQSGNPAGRPPVPKDVKKARSLNQFRLERIANKYLHLSKDELWEKYESGTTRGLDLLIIGILLKAVTKGDVNCANFFMERLIGKVKTTVEISRPGAKPLEERINGMTDEELEIYYANLEAKVKGDG